MIGDLATSFVKRRLGFGSGAPVRWLDPVLEALLPVLWLAWAGVVAMNQALGAAAVFVVIHWLVQK